MVCKFHVELGTAYVVTVESSLVGARTSISSDMTEFVRCALLLRTGKVGVRTLVCLVVTDCANMRATPWSM